jgi:MFS transporter, DHA1 family, tetracycline resistance protein
MRKSPLAILFVTVFLDLLGFGIVIPFMAYTVEAFGASAGVVGLLVGTFSLAQFLFAPLWGRLSDRVGRRPILLLGLAGSATGYFLFGAAGSLAMLFAGRIVAGVAGATIPTAQAYIADVTTPENRAKGMGIIGAAFGLGFIVGPALGGILAPLGLPLAAALDGTALGPLSHLLRQQPYALPCLVAATLSGLDFFAAIFLLPESLSPELRAQAASRVRVKRLVAAGEVLSDQTLRLLVTTFFLFLLGFAMMEATLTLLVENRLGGVTAETHRELVHRVGYLFATIGAVSALLQGGLVGPLTRRFGERTLLEAGLVVVALGLVLLPLWHSWPAYFFGAAFVALGSGLINPTLNSLISRAAGKDRQGQTLGVSQSAGALARVLGPVAGGALFGQLGPASPYLVAATLVATSAVIALRAPRGAALKSPA